MKKISTNDHIPHPNRISVHKVQRRIFLSLFSFLHCRCVSLHKFAVFLDVPRSPLFPSRLGYTDFPYWVVRGVQERKELPTMWCCSETENLFHTMLIVWWEINNYSPYSWQIFLNKLTKVFVHFSLLPCWLLLFSFSKAQISHLFSG